MNLSNFCWPRKKIFWFFKSLLCMELKFCSNNWFKKLILLWFDENRNFKRVATSHNQFLGNNLFGPNWVYSALNFENREKSKFDQNYSVYSPFATKAVDETKRQKVNSINLLFMILATVADPNRIVAHF